MTYPTPRTFIASDIVCTIEILSSTLAVSLPLGGLMTANNTSAVVGVKYSWSSLYVASIFKLISAELGLWKETFLTDRWAWRLDPTKPDPPRLNTVWIDPIWLVFCTNVVHNTLRLESDSYGAERLRVVHRWILWEPTLPSVYGCVRDTNCRWWRIGYKLYVNKSAASIHEARECDRVGTAE